LGIDPRLFEKAGVHIHVPAGAVPKDVLEQIRNQFPQPVSDSVHDAYFVFSILRALDQMDAMKSEVPLLGQVQELDYDAAQQARIADQVSDIEQVSRMLVEWLLGMPIWGHPHTQINVVPPPSISGIIGSLLPAIYNPNLVKTSLRSVFPSQRSIDGSIWVGVWAWHGIYGKRRRQLARLKISPFLALIPPIQ
jgi:hypothetical protein